MTLALSILSAALACAQEAPPSSFELSPASSAVLLGAPFEIAGAARIPEGMSLSPVARGTTGPFDILDVRTGPPRRVNGSLEVPVRLKVAAFELGNVVFPRLDWAMTASGGSSRTVLSPPVPLVVSPPSTAGQGADIRDIKGPMSPAPWPWLAAFAALLAALGWAAFRFRRARDGQGGLAEPGPEAKSPEETANEELDALPGLGLEAKEFYDRLSDILRGYLSKRYGIDALQMTSCDLHRALRAAAVEPGDARTRTKALLDRCDLAKFARYVPKDSERPRDVESAKALVRDTSRPVPPAGRP